MSRKKLFLCLQAQIKQALHCEGSLSTTAIAISRARFIWLRKYFKHNHAFCLSRDLYDV